jgi:hypothetical protein
LRLISTTLALSRFLRLGIWRTLQPRALRRGRVRAATGRGLSQRLLDGAGQGVLSVERHERIVTSHLDVAVTRDLGCLDGAAADFLPPSDVGAPERVKR